jgi:hypothetical protein
MSRLAKIVLGAVAVVLATSAPSRALVGIGVHYGLDLSLSMKNTTGYGDHVTFDSLKLDLGPTTGNAVLSGDEIPLYITRSGFKPDFGFGGKVYIDIIPFIDAVEISADFGLWDYVGRIKYPTGIVDNPTSPLTDPNNFTYDSTELTLDNFGLSYFGLKNTPYAKLQLDATVRKYIVRAPKMLKVFNLYGGAGFTVNFATPVLSNGLVQDVIKESANNSLDLNTLGPNLLDNSEIMKGVVNKIIGGLTKPSYGAHVDLGFMVKIPVIPIGVYVDGKFMIPFGKLDTYVDGLGVLLNGGVALAF